MDDDFDCGIDNDEMFSDEPITIDDDGPGFYLSSTDAACHGALMQVGEDDGGMGFYI